ncbi:MAG: hypothetical protein JPMHGGIA_01201 [Saprospiraceae bacterium]|jgi:hypothetical protein|nr:hypothetical protein [Saprospiraceae bacterium]
MHHVLRYEVNHFVWGKLNKIGLGFIISVVEIFFIFTM